jgi:hypothetical protein
MSTHLTVFCRSRQLLPIQTLIDEIKNGVFFDDSAWFEPAPGTEEAATTDWKSFQIYYQPDKRPVVITHDVNNAQVQLLIQEAGDKLAQAGLAEKHADLLEHLTTTYQTFVFEIDSWGATDDAWAMVDSIEAFLARTLDGVIAADEGFYNQDLQLICRV